MLRLKEVARPVTALGFGLAAFVVLAAVQTSIDGTIARRVPAEAPDYFVLDIARERTAAFSETVRAADPDASIRLVPALRGSVVAYGPPDSMTRTADLEDVPDGAWALRGERGLTYANTVPPGNVVTTPRSDVMFVVTEYGIVNLKGKSVAERAKALIDVAHPDFQEGLERQAYEHRLIPRGVSF